MIFMDCCLPSQNVRRNVAAPLLVYHGALPFCGNGVEIST